MIREIGPGHRAALEQAKPSLRAFLAILLRDGTPEPWLALFALDVRSVAGGVAGEELLGADRVSALLDAEDVPVVAFPLSGRSDILTMLSVVAPELISRVEERPGTVTVVLVDQDGDGRILWLDPEELLA